jgi:tetratricopeptide (TPR) repeat protein
VPLTLNTSSDTSVEIYLRVISHVWLIYTLWLLGYPDQALACSQRTVAAARDLEYALPLQLALSIGQAGAHYLRREPRAMQAALAQLAALDDDASLAVFQPWVLLFEGWLMAVDQRAAAGLEQMHQAIQLWEKEAGSQGGMLLQYTLLIEGYLALGQAEAALAPLDAMLDFIDATDFRAAEAEFVRLRGEAWRALGQPDKAEACFQRALAVARAQPAKTWELRAVMSLCRLYQAAGQATKLATARAQLTKVYDWFTEGLDTPDLQAAAALLGGHAG